MSKVLVVEICHLKLAMLYTMVALQWIADASCSCSGQCSMSARLLSDKQVKKPTEAVCDGTHGL